MKRHLFIDFLGIDAHQGVTRKMNPPVKMGPVVTQDRLWRSYLTGYYGQVMEKDGLLHMWTNCGWGDEKQFPDSKAGPRYGRQRYVQHLVSGDGLHWDSPCHGVIDCDGGTANNLIYKDGMEGTLLYEEDAPLQERWKYVHAFTIQGVKGIGLSLSPDGLHWKDTDRLCFGVNGDSQNVCFFDPVIGQYALYYRSFTGAVGSPDHGRYFPRSGEGHRERSVARVAFGSFEELNHIPHPQTNVIYPDARDPEHLDIYTNATVRYPLADNVVLAFPSLYQKYPWSGPKEAVGSVLPYNNGVLGTQLAVSRDGEHFERIRAPYVTGDPVGGMDSASNYFHTGMVIRKDHVLQYYWGGNHTHGGDSRYADPPQWHRNAVYALRQRMDGFCSMDFDYQGGMLLTAPFTLPQGGLHLNLNTHAWGSMAVEVCDPSGAPLPGLGKADFRPLSGNYLDIAAWPQASLHAFAGETVRLRFLGQGVKLYSYWFA